MSDSATYRAVNAVWRIESAKIITGFARLVRDLGLADALDND
jgi:predicted RNA polymerase sigma factor